jgi:catechol 2,3-dioxygenase-like lactoylglutathione lyase family enzyme
VSARGGLQTRAPQTRQSSGLRETNMKRLHVHVSVEDLQHSIGFYSALFASEPTVTKRDYAKWMLDDPRVNFAISTRSRQRGLAHLGIQVEDKQELGEIYGRLRAAGGAIVEQGEKRCCYAQSEKSWIEDPAGIAWEAFLTKGDVTDYGDGTGEREARVAHAKAPELSEPVAAESCGCAPKAAACC